MWFANITGCGRKRRFTPNDEDHALASDWLELLVEVAGITRTTNTEKTPREKKVQDVHEQEYVYNVSSL